MDSTSEYRFLAGPQYVGFWCVTSTFRISSIKRPSWLRRLLVKALIGWTWTDCNV